ncbi:MAG: enoyl-CoA hydratase [Gammaproteobacteria bacterium]|nr:MAG: enoyl-CoA hydratase [Gammaproteobacteria bacterium]
MEFDYVRYERLDDIVKITIDRPDVMNVISRKVYAELDAHLATAEEDSEIKVIVIAGSGDNFGAGHDIGSEAMRGELDEYPRDFSRLGRVQAMDRGVYWRMHDRWRNIGKPTIAMVQGYCIMGSWMLVSACDLTVAADDAKFADRSVRWGGANHEYPTQFWELGIKKAKEYLWTGDFIDASEALRLGLVNRVVPRDKLEEATLWLARRIALNSLYSLQVSKMSINQAADIMGQSAAVRASGNFWIMSTGGGKASQEASNNDRVDWSKAQNERFDEQDEGRPW